MNTTNMLNSLRIIWTIASRDTLDVLRIKNAVTTLALMVVLLAIQTWSAGLHLDDYQDLVVYDEGQSRLVSLLDDDSDVRLRRVATQAELDHFVGDYTMGLVIPAGFDQALEEGGRPTLSAYVSWASRAYFPEMGRKFEEYAGELLGQPVQVDIEGNVLSPDPDAVGPGRAAVVGIIVMMIWMAVGSIPYLMLDEKETRTLDALLVSPASLTEVVLGKALAGLFYSTLGTIVALALNRIFVMNWPLAIIASAAGLLLSVGLGLAAGTLIDSAKKLSAVTLPITIVLILPVMFMGMEDIFSDAFNTLLRASPAVALARLYWYACSNHASPGVIFGSLGYVLGTTALVYALVIRKLRQADR